MVQEMDVRALVDQGDKALIEGKVTEAAALYSRGLEVDGDYAPAHLGVAKAYLALGTYGYVYIACQRVQQLAPNSAQALTARAILLVLDQHYDSAVRELDAAEKLEAGQPYVHALRGYCYRRLGNTYDAMSAESKAARLSGNREWAHLFPKAQPLPAGLPGQVAANPFQAPPSPPAPNLPPGATQQREVPRPWTERSQMDRRMVQARWATRSTPVVTLVLLVANVAVYIACAALSHNFIEPANASNPLYVQGESVGALILQDPAQAYRLVTAMFLHLNYIHIALNMISLYAVGAIVERVYGSWRFLFLYFATGIIAGAAEAFLQPNVAAIGASGAIFGIFGAFGAFLLMRRRQLGPVAGPMTSQWIFFLILNIAISVGVPGIALYDHLGGLISGLVIGALLLAAEGRRQQA